MEHDYILERIVPNDLYRWVIFCRKCGHVAYFGNNTNDSTDKMQANLPRPCVQPAKKEKTNGN